MSSFGIIVSQPFIQISLQLLDGLIDLFAERDLVKLLQDRLVKPLADAVCPRRFHLGFGMVDVVNCQEELEVVFVDTPAIFRSAICQDTQHWQVVLFVERQHPVSIAE